MSAVSVRQLTQHSLEQAPLWLLLREAKHLIDRSYAVPHVNGFSPAAAWDCAL